jgi:hypothetical protein
MPLGEAQPVQLFPAQINVPTANGLMIGMSVQSDGTASPETLNAAVLDLVDLLQGWPGKHPAADVTAQLYNVELVPATPTNPVPPPDPPVDPPTE